MNGHEKKLVSILNDLQLVDPLSIQRKEPDLELSLGEITPTKDYPYITDVLELAVCLYVHTPLPPGPSAHLEYRKLIITRLSRLRIQKYHSQVLQVVLSHSKHLDYASKTAELQPYITDALMRCNVLQDVDGLLHLLSIIPMQEKTCAFLVWTLTCLLEAPAQQHSFEIASLVIHKFVKSQMQSSSSASCCRGVFRTLFQILDRNSEKDGGGGRGMDILELFLVAQLNNQDNNASIKPQENHDQFCCYQLNLFVDQLLIPLEVLAQPPLIKPQTMATIMNWCTKGSTFRLLSPRVVTWLLEHGAQVPPYAAYRALQENDVPRLWHILSMVSPQHPQLMYLDHMQKWYPQQPVAHGMDGDVIMDLNPPSTTTFAAEPYLDDSAYLDSNPYEGPFDADGLANEALAASTRQVLLRDDSPYGDRSQTIDTLLTLFLQKCIIKGGNHKLTLKSYLPHVSNVVTRLVTVLNVDVGQHDVELCREAIQKYHRFLLSQNTSTQDHLLGTAAKNFVALKETLRCLRTKCPVLHVGL